MPPQDSKTDDQVVHALVRLIFDQFAKQKINTIPKYAVHKVLYLVKQKALDNNLIKNSVTFFWYKYGPFSEEINNTIKSMVNKSIIRYNVNGYQLVAKYDISQNMTNDNSFQKLEQIITNIIKNNSPRDILDQVYSKPKHSWYIDYKEFQKQFKEYVYFSNEDNYLANNKILELFYQTLATVPDNKKFYLTYYKFSRVFIPLIEDYSPYIHRKVFEDFDSIIGDIWDAFAYYAAIMHHEPSHEENVKGWASNLDETLFTIKLRINGMMGLIGRNPDKELAEELKSELETDSTPSVIFTPEELLAKLSP